MQKPQSIPDMLKSKAETIPDRPAHYTLSPNGTWEETTWKNYVNRVSAISAGLQKAGLKPGTNVGIMVPTSQTWEFVQMAILSSGGVVVGIDPNETLENINHITKKTELSGIVVQHSELLEKINPEHLSNMAFQICVNEIPTSEKGGDRCISLKDIQKAGEKKSIFVEGNDPATIIFTSGTTGRSKGIMYRHDQVLTACKSLLNRFDDMDGSFNFPCWLPLSNLFQRMINFCAIDLGAAVYFVENPKEMITLLPQINPHLFIGVPRIFEKVYESIEMQIKAKPPWQQKLIEFSIQIGDRYAASKRDNINISYLDRIKYEFADRLVLKKIRSFLGTNMRYFISGSASMPLWLLEKYHALGILVLEAYGISENIIPNAMNTPKEYRFGSVGKPMSENEIRIQEDGELLVRGPGVFEGYYKSNSAKDKFSIDGYFPTGDYVSIDRDGYLYVTGRKSEIFKTSTGRKIAPVGIEERLRQASYVEYAVVFGAGKKFIIALVTISNDFFLKQAGSKDLEERLDFLVNDLSKLIEPIPGYQRPAGILITEYPFSVASKELTSNFKLNRRNIETRFKSQVDEVYRHLETRQGNCAYPFAEQDNLFVYLI